MPTPMESVATERSRDLDVEVCEVDPYRCDMYLEAIFFLVTLKLFPIFRLLDSGLEKYVCRC